MVGLGRRTLKETGYNPRLFVQMISERGGLATAKHLLGGRTESSGIRELWERGRLDLTAEALALSPRFAELFSDEERGVARRRLDAYGYSH